MATSFKGLYLCPPKQPRPTHVQVQDAEQAKLKLSLEEYEARGGRPSMPMAPSRVVASYDVGPPSA